MTPLQALAKLMELPPAAPNHYLAASLELIGATIACREGFGLLSVRVVDEPNDPLLGYRMMNLWLAGPRTVAKPAFTDAVMQNPDAITYDPFFQEIARAHGTCRTYHRPDPRTVPGLENSLEAHLMHAIGARDLIKLVRPCSAGVEVIIGFHRFTDEAAFSERDEQVLAQLNEGLALWGHRVALLHGFGGDYQPLTARETEMAALLLGASAQKTHAEALEISQPRAAEITREVHRKLGTGNRAELQRMWMTNAREVSATLPVDPRTRRRSQRS